LKVRDALASLPFQKCGILAASRDHYDSSVSRTSAERAVDKIRRLSVEAEDIVSFWNACTEVLDDTVPYYWTPCWYTLDPASLLITSHYHHGMVKFPAEWLKHEYYGDDFNKIADVVRSPRGICTLHEATEGNPSKSQRWHMNMTLGGDQELLLGLRTRTGEVWGALGLYRAPDQPLFAKAEMDFLHMAAPHLAHGARQTLLMGEAADPEGPEAPGLIILNERFHVESTTPGVERLVSELPDGNWQAGRLPSSVQAIAARAMRIAAEPGVGGEIAVSRVLSRAGNWLVLHGAALGSLPDQRIAIIVEPAHPGRIYPLLMSAYGLTEREQDVTRLVLQGNSTREIADSLVVSVHTVQQHLKTIFEKTGVRSRRDLVGKVFFPITNLGSGTTSVALCRTSLYAAVPWPERIARSTGDGRCSYRVRWIQGWLSEAGALQEGAGTGWGVMCW
jgi:DNA-binding CsgD family transcriptional regulator